MFGAAGLMLSYAALMSISYLRGVRGASCGCSGPGRDHAIGPWLVLRNLVLAASFLAASLGPSLMGWQAYAMAFSSAVCFGLTYMAIEQLQQNHHLLNNIKQLRKLG